MIPAPQQAHGYSSNNGYQVMYGFDFNQPPIQHPAQQPPSPTLTNPEMILPFEIENHIIRTPSPTRGNQTPSPAATPPGLGRPLTYGNSMPNSYVNFSRTSPQSHHRISTALSDIEEVDTTPTGPRYPGIKPATLASSPALKENGAMGLVDWKTHSRRLSDGSSSVRSEELANMKWPGFDSAHGTDVESVVLEEEEDNYGTLPKVVDSDDGSVIDEPWLGPHAGEDDDEDLLSKRADMILANAKQRLNVGSQTRYVTHSPLANFVSRYWKETFEAHAILCWQRHLCQRHLLTLLPLPTFHEIEQAQEDRSDCLSVRQSLQTSGILECRVTPHLLPFFPYHLDYPFYKSGHPAPWAHSQVASVILKDQRLYAV